MRIASSRILRPTTRASQISCVSRGRNVSDTVREPGFATGNWVSLDTSIVLPIVREVETAFLIRTWRRFRYLPTVAEWVAK